MEIEKHKFKSSDGVIDYDMSFDDLVYSNATEQYQKFGKDQTTFSHYKTNVLIPYAQKLIDMGKISPCKKFMVADNQQVTIEDLIVVRMGGKDPALRGTWIHPKLEIVFSRWLNDEFAIWCDEKISDLLANGVVTLQPEDKKWVNIIEDLRNGAPGNAWYMGQVREALLIHEKEGYNIKAFKELVEFVKQDTPKANRSKVFKKLRKLITEMYEVGELGRTSHEAMLEYCVDTVVEVLEKEVRATKRLLNKIELKPIAPSIKDLTLLNKVEHDTLVKQGAAIIDTKSLYCHKIFGLSLTPSSEPIPAVRFGSHFPVADCLMLIKEKGYKVVFGNKLNAKEKGSKEGAPDLKYKDGCTNIGVALWFKDGGYFSCSIQKSYKEEDGNWNNKPMLDISLYSNTSIDPAFFTGTNPNGTIRVAVLVGDDSAYCMVYGRSSDKF
jgi:hypothetical protein